MSVDGGRYQAEAGMSAGNLDAYRHHDHIIL